ncbi:MAG: Ig domain-containing protein [Planctomycetota bacterium]
MTRRLIWTLFFLELVMTFSLIGCILPKPALYFDPEQLPSGIVGTPYAVTIQIYKHETPVGGMTIAQGNTLPPGLTMTFNQDKGSAEITGTPTKSGIFNFIVTAWCYGTQTSGQTGQKEYTIQIK